MNVQSNFKMFTRPVNLNSDGCVLLCNKNYFHIYYYFPYLLNDSDAVFLG